ncbi:MAG: hypothetical protein RLZZ597_688 [Cyanobacteriota bacterium]
MKQRIGQLAALAIAVAAGLGTSLMHDRIAQANDRLGHSTLAAEPSSIYRIQAPIVLQGVVAPLNSLRLMKRALASSTTTSTLRDLPLLAILNEPLKTTGIGPIQIGMTLEELEDTGLTPIAIEGSGQGACQYYRIEGNSEPIGLMAVDNRILRIDVWPGSITETLSGAKIGSTEADLVRLYRGQLEATANPITLGKTIVFTPRDPGEDLFRLVFETDDRGRVVQYRAGQFPSVTWPEGCL